MSRPVVLVLMLAILAAVSPVAAQVVTATIPVGSGPISTAINPVTNKAYTVDCGNDSSCQSAGTVTVVDGTTLARHTIAVGVEPVDVAVNSATNKVYVVNKCGNGPCHSGSGTVTVIDGMTLSTQTVAVGYIPQGIAVDEVTNKIYVHNLSGVGPYGNSLSTVTVIDGATLATQTVAAGYTNPNPKTSSNLPPPTVAVNPVTNKIYVANSCGNNSEGNCQYVNGAGTITVIDGVTLATRTVTVGWAPQGVSVNPVTNKAYVANSAGNGFSGLGTMTVIDGVTLATRTVTVANNPQDTAVNPSTNQIYVTNLCGNDNFCNNNGTVTVVDGATLSTQSVDVGFEPVIVGVDPVADKAYVANIDGSCHFCSDGLVTVIDGETLSTFPVAVGDIAVSLAISPATSQIYVPNYDNTVSLIGGNTRPQFVPITPCRVVDTRNPDGTFGGPSIPGGGHRNFPIPRSPSCSIPSSAIAYSLNVTVVPDGPLSYLTIWPTSRFQPVSSTLNSPDGRVKANAAIAAAGLDGAISVYASNPTNVILDIDGYFAPQSSSTLQFYAVTPCRVVDTRGDTGDLGGPFLQGSQERDFPVLESPCIPQGVDPQAYSFNVTAVPHIRAQRLGYLTVWPAGESQPVVSTLNNPTGTIVANAAIVSAGTGGAVAVYPNGDTDLLIDIDGYFAAPGTGGLSLYPAVQCRALDTRLIGNGRPFGGELTVNVAGSSCALPANAQAYIFNATVVPSGSLPYLTLWPDGETQPDVSTLNAKDGIVTSNMAIVPTLNGSIDAYAFGLTQLLLDISSFFAP